MSPPGLPRMRTTAAAMILAPLLRPRLPLLDPLSPPLNLPPTLQPSTANPRISRLSRQCPSAGIAREVQAPFGYHTAADLEGGERILVYPHPINSNSRESVNLANKTRAREVYRARKRFGLPLARQSMADRQFTTTHFDWLSTAHEAYAMLHNGRLSPGTCRRCDGGSAGDGRTEQALRALHSRTPEFKDLRDGYQS